jgi:hypothetical protein
VPGFEVCGGDAGGGGAEVDVGARQPEVEHRGRPEVWGVRFENGANGCDVHARRCPECQEGKVGSLCGRRRVGWLGS